MKRLMIGLMVLMAGSAWATPSTTITLPNSFTPNTTIQSSQVNADFNEVQTQYNNHTHTDITQVGAITSGSWLGTAISTTYGGTGQDFSGSAQGSLIYFSAAGTTATLSPGTAGQVLKTGGAGANPSWTSNTIQDVILRGLELDYATGSSVTASAGVVCVGSTVVDSATSYTLGLGVQTDWASGTAVTYTSADWCYVGINNEGKLRFLGKVAPNVTDVSGNKQGTKYYLNQSGYYWRVLGAVRVNAGVLTDSWRQSGNNIMLNTPVQVTTALSSGAWSSAVSCSSAIPNISNYGIFGTRVTGNTDPRMQLWMKPNGTTWTTNGEDASAGYGFSGGGGEWDSQFTCLTDNAQQIQHREVGVDLLSCAISVQGYQLNIR